MSSNLIDHCDLHLTSLIDLLRHFWDIFVIMCRTFFSKNIPQSFTVLWDILGYFSKNIPQYGKWFNWIHTKILAFFQPWVISCSVSIQTQHHCSTIKCSVQSVFRWPIESGVMSLKHSWSWNFFQLMERHRSWDSVLILIYQIDAHDLKNGNVHARKRWKNALHLSMNSALLDSDSP